MESYLMMTQINDFLFCPRSMYFSGIYRNTVNTDMFHQLPQTVGQSAHAAVDEHRYSTRKSIITGMTVYSERYNLLGCIDIFDVASGLLTERKYSITAVYDGFRYQLFAQYFALTEMGYTVNQMRLHSSKDNKNYDIELPDANTTKQFEKVLDDIRCFSLFNEFKPNPNRCHHCIYAPLCDYGCMEEELQQ